MLSPAIPSRGHTALSCTALLALTLPLHGQQTGPHIGYIYPAGGRAGSTFQATVGGQRLEGTDDVRLCGAGVTAGVVEYSRPLSGREFLLLRDKLKELTDKQAAAQAAEKAHRPATTRPWTPEDEKELAQVKRKLANPPNRQANPAIAETVTLQVTIAPHAQPGPRELRLQTRQGLTNPLAFCVGQLTEFSEDEASGEAKPPRAEPSPPRPRDPSAPRTAAADHADQRITLPAVINGQILPGDVDRFSFEARKGQRLVASVTARELMPYLADAVPGWFQASIALYDAEGRELAYDDDYRFHPDPVLSCEIPADGHYVLEIKDALYRGREDFVYRITVGELPFLTGVFPLGGRAGEATRVGLQGWNLPSFILMHDATSREAGISPLSVRRGKQASNTVPFALDTLPECMEKEPNDEPPSAQTIKLPTIVNGRIQRRGDRDVLRWEGRTGDEIVAQVSARRLGSPLDSVLRLTDSAGQPLAFNDDCEDKAAGLITHHADSSFRATLPADDTYYLYVGDARDDGGPEYGYRLRISPPRPDFELRVVPSAIHVRGRSAAVTVHAIRRDGFTGAIELALKDAPPGFRLSGARIAEGQDQARVTLTAPPTPSPAPLPLTLEGRARIQEQEVTRTAVPAEDMMQAFAYRHLVPAQEFLVTFSPPPPPRPGRTPATTQRTRDTAPRRANASGHP